MYCHIAYVNAVIALNPYTSGVGQPTPTVLAEVFNGFFSLSRLLSDYCLKTCNDVCPPSG